LKLGKLKGAFVWHPHEAEDELFLVTTGELLIKFRDREIRVCEEEFVMVTRELNTCPSPNRKFTWF
jgi:mannose-6-phosphate isomerase-like protein (cupin superfamily)